MIGTDLVYAVGDAHGRDDLLAELLAQIDAHAAGRPHGLIFLGDYIDRGPASAAVMRRLMALQHDRPPETVICLRGNHEQMALDALAAGGGWQFNLWRKNGGDATLASYGAPEPSPEYLDLIPSDHRAWLAGLPLLHRDAHRIYVHAGLEPHTPVGEQDAETFLWIREAFLRAPPGSFPAYVVHGHTPEWAGKADLAAPELLPHRTNLDTGAYTTGVLAAGVFGADEPGGPLELLHTAEVAEYEGGLKAAASSVRFRGNGPEANRPALPPDDGRWLSADAGKMRFYSSTRAAAIGWLRRRSGYDLIVRPEDLSRVGCVVLHEA